MKKVAPLLGLLSLVLVFTGIASADQRTSNLQVSANVVAYCTVSTSSVNFGNVTGEGATFTNLTTGGITVNCPAELSYAVTLDAGQHFDGNYRRVSDGTYFVGYQLWTDEYSGFFWGDTGFANTYTGSHLSAIGSGSEQSYPVYAGLYASSSIPSGVTLNDTVTATVWY